MARHATLQSAREKLRQAVPTREGDARQRVGEGVPVERDLRRQQVKRVIVIVMLLVVMAVPPVFVNHPIGYLPLVTFIFMLLLSFVYLRLIARGFSVEHDFAETSCLRGSSVDFPIVMKNGSHLPILRARPQLFVKNPYGELEREVLAIAMVDGRGQDRMSANVQLGHVGTYTAGLRGVVLYDPLMVFQTYKKVEGDAQLVSLPRDYAVDVVRFSDMAVHESSMPVRTVISDNVDYAGTRNYVFGDPLKSVHWKLSARAGELQTRLFEASVNTKLSVIIDFHAPAYDNEALMGCTDAIVEMALGIMRLAVRRSIEASLCYVDKNGERIVRALPKNDEMEHFVRNLPLLSAEVDAQDALGIAESEMSRFGGSDSIAFCTSAITQGLVTRAVEMRGSHLSVAVVVAVPRDAVRAFYRDNQGAMTELSNAGVLCTVLSDASDLERPVGHE